MSNILFAFIFLSMLAFGSIFIFIGLHVLINGVPAYPHIYKGHPQ